MPHATDTDRPAPPPRARRARPRTAGRSRRFAALALLAALVPVLGACASSALRVVDPVAMVDIGAGVTGPEGLHAEVVATGLPNVSALAYDDEGRLWAATAAFEDGGTDGVRLVDLATGTATQVVTDIATPMGLVWSDGWLYIASMGRVDAFSAFDAATGAFAEQRTVVELPEGVGLSGALAVGADGRLSLAISAPCDACEPTTELAGSVVSFEPDGSDLRVDAADLRAPVGLAYEPGTDRLFATLNQRDDLGDATPGDLLAVVAAGQRWGFPDCTGLGAVPGVDASTCADVPHPVAELDEHAAVSGVTFVTGQLGSDVGTAAVVAEWATGRVEQVHLTTAADGTVTGTASDLLRGIAKPVAVLAAPDGSLLVGDWAGGSIYRISTGGSATAGTTA